MEGDLDTLLSIQRTGARGRILYVLARQALEILGIACKAEPIFDPVPPDPWYVEFAREHALKLREHPFYNPDFFLESGTWLEVTLSENSAYKKLLRYGHQAEKLEVLWLDPDLGLHKSVCQNVTFPNARVTGVHFFYDELCKKSGGEELVRKFKMLQRLKGTLL